MIVFVWTRIHGRHGNALDDFSEIVVVDGAEVAPAGVEDARVAADVLVAVNAEAVVRVPDEGGVAPGRLDMAAGRGFVVVATTEGTDE